MHPQPSNSPLTTVVILALFGAGVYKCVVTARLPTVIAKGAYSLALMLVAWGIWLVAFSGVITLDRRGRPILLESDATFLSQVFIVCGIIALAALVLAVLGLREAAMPRSADEEFAPIPGRGMAITTIVSFFLLFALYFVAAS
jgi:hypothetical protein